MTAFWTIIGGLIVYAAAAFCIFRAVVSARTPQGAVGWVVFLLTLPFIAVPAYLFLGHHKLRAYTEARRRSRELRRPLAAVAAAHPPDPAAYKRLIAFERLTQLPVISGNGADLLIDGEATFDAIFAAIDGAEHYVCVQFYTILEDGLGGVLAEHLLAAAGRGVVVRVIYDGVGSYGLPQSYRQRLRDAGIEIVNPHQARGPTSRFQINFRNHRKTVIVDGRIGFLGGHNVSDEYMGRYDLFSPWRDTHIAIRGPIVSQLQLAFVEDWHWSTEESLADKLSWISAKDEADMTALIVPMGPGDRLDTGALFFACAIAEARERVWIASPYFVPDIDTVSALAAAALRGRDVRVIVPDKADHYLTWLAAFAYFDSVREAGVKIYRYSEGFMHQKVILIDDEISCVGTANLDNRSFRLNFETMAVLHDRRFAAKVEKMLTDDLGRSVLMEKTLSQQKLIIRYGAQLARLFAPVL